MIALVLASALPALSAAGSGKSLLISNRDFQALSPQRRQEYVRAVRQAILDLERAEKFKLASATPQNSTRSVFFETFLPLSGALDSSYCTVGGVARTTVPGPNGDGLCPTTGRSCEGRPNSFKCGVIFSGHCVDREPIDGLSQRCFDASKANDTVTPEQFAAVQKDVLEINEKVCQPKKPTAESPCGLFQYRMGELMGRFAKREAGDPPATAATLPATQGNAEAGAKPTTDELIKPVGEVTLASAGDKPATGNQGDRFFYCRAFLEKANTSGELKRFAGAFKVDRDGKIPATKPVPKGVTHFPPPAGAIAQSFQIIDSKKNLQDDLHVEDKGGDPRLFEITETAILNRSSDAPSVLGYKFEFEMRNGHCLPITVSRTLPVPETKIFDFDACYRDKFNGRNYSKPAGIDCTYMPNFMEAAKDARFEHKAIGSRNVPEAAQKAAQ